MANPLRSSSWQEHSLGGKIMSDQLFASVGTLRSLEPGPSVVVPLVPLGVRSPPLHKPKLREPALPKLMLVEDEWIVALNLRQRLRKLGYTVCAIAASGSEALRKISEHRPDLLLMDIHIDGPMDGIETVAKIPAELHIGVIYLTAHSEAPTMTRAKRTRPYGYLLKPFSEGELQATIQMAFERRKAEEAMRQSVERLRHAYLLTPDAPVPFSADAAILDGLIHATDTAMDAANAHGRRGYAFCKQEMTAASIRYADECADLRRGLEQGELRLHYQPQVSMTTGEITGVEALLRWQHDTKGLLGPASIIPVAEKSGLIVEIGEWVVREACAQAAAWGAAAFPPLTICINVSAQQIHRGGLLECVRETLSETGISADQLQLEITESTIQNEPDCIFALHELRDLGLMLAIDDFGTGYSCLRSLKSLPIQWLKIDQGFVRGIPDDPGDLAITAAIIAVAHRLKLQVIAKGMETPAQEAFLQSHGCGHVQGYLYTGPLPPAAIPAFIARSNRCRSLKLDLTNPSGAFQSFGFNSIAPED